MRVLFLFCLLSLPSYSYAADVPERSDDEIAEIRAQENARLVAMRDAFEKVKALDQDNVDVMERAVAWRRFEDAFNSDVPQTTEDNDMAAYARSRMEALKRLASEE